VPRDFLGMVFNTDQPWDGYWASSSWMEKPSST